MDIQQQLTELARHHIYVHTYLETIGSDEWVFGFRIDYLPAEAWNLKRRAPALKQVESFQLSGGATYSGGWDTMEEALLSGIVYARKKLLAVPYLHQNP